MIKFLPGLLTVGTWNIEGAFYKVNGTRHCKLDEEPFKATLKKFDILCLQETHCHQNETFTIPTGYYATPHCRKISKNSRYFGGMLLLVKSQFKKGIKINKNLDVDALEITLLHNFFDIEEDIKIIFTYASPLNSCYTKSRPENILEKLDMNLANARSTTLVMGDLNGRTQVAEDFVRDALDEHSPINLPFYIRDSVLKRENSDTHTIDKQGKIILDLCKTHSMRILNGRLKGDMTGTFTRYPKNQRENPSVIDYALCGESLLPNISSFTVLPFTELSDHCCIAMNIKICIPPSPGIRETPKVKLNPNPTRLTYQKDKKHVFQANIMLSDKFDTLLSTLNKSTQPEFDVNLCVIQLNHVILESATRTFTCKYKSKTKKKTAKKKSKTWFTQECDKLRRHLRKLSKDVSKFPFDKGKLASFNRTKAEYKNTCRKAERESRNILKKKLLEIGTNDPKGFWNIINEMNNWGNKRSGENEKIKPHTWNEYFKKLLNKPTANTPCNSSYTPTFNPILDGIITLEELRAALKQLKRNKAAGPDGILVEYIKAFGETYEGILWKIMKEIFCRQVYPSEWNSNFLKPIYKKGDNEDPGNFRGLAIGSALAKLFSMILLNRLVKHISEEKLISPNQIGFMMGARTSDHTFLLQTLIEKVVKKNKKKLFAAFIDYSKAYDTVDRDKLFERLKSIGINGIFLKNLIAMYENPSYKIKLKDGHLDPIKSNLGLKQGCPLSPMLFNLYIDDINTIFDKECDPVKLHDEDLSHFLYADDLVLVSMSANGLQRSLDKLSKYSDDKCLTISIKKSKSMIFNLSGRLEKTQFNINGSPIEAVNRFCYLGFDFCPSGTVAHGINTLNDKAKKAMRPLKIAIARFDLPIKVARKMFHTYISPILLYNVETWGKFTDKQLNDYTQIYPFKATDDCQTDTIHRSYFRYLLGLSKSAPNTAIYGETTEHPQSLKGHRLLLNFWKRISKLPDECLVKKALTENISIRTNWIKTVEKLLATYRLTDVPDKNFKAKSQENIQKYFINAWKLRLNTENLSRLQVYKQINQEFSIPKHLDLPFPLRKIISKIRCSNHVLEIEKGRHPTKIVPKEERLCIVCHDMAMEDENHFLLSCQTYQHLRELYGIHDISITRLLNTDNQKYLGLYLLSAFELRSRLLQGRMVV